MASRSGPSVSSRRLADALRTVYRALVEGIAYGTPNASEAVERLGGTFVEPIVAGGILRSLDGP